MPMIAEKHMQMSNASADWRWTGDAWDRRSSVRLELNYSLRLRRTGTSCDIETQTRNVSNTGFYFHSSAPFRPQEHVEYEIILPWSPCADAPAGAVREEVVLRGMAKVVRVDKSRDGAPAGIACSVDGEYTISSREDDRASPMQTLPVTAEAC